LDAILEKFSEWLVARGIPVCRTLLNLPTIEQILAAKASTKSAFGIHGLTAVLMVLAAMPLMIGVP